MLWPTHCNFSQALLCCGKKGRTQMSISLCRRLGISQKLYPLGCSLTSFAPSLRQEVKSPSLAFLAFSLPHLYKSTEELHPCILTLLKVTINSTFFSAKSIYLHRSVQPNFCTIIQNTGNNLFLSLDCRNIAQKASTTGNGLMLEAWSLKGWLHWGSCFSTGCTIFSLASTGPSSTNIKVSL